MQLFYTRSRDYPYVRSRMERLPATFSTRFNGPVTELVSKKFPGDEGKHREPEYVLRTCAEWVPVGIILFSRKSATEISGKIKRFRSIFHVFITFAKEDKIVANERTADQLSHRPRLR